VERIEKHDIDDYKIFRSKQTSRKTGELMTRDTTNLELITLKRMFKEMLALGNITSNPTIEVKLLKKSEDKFHVITEEEELIYLIDCPSQLQDVAAIMLETGMRCPEVYRIKKSEVFLDRGYLDVTKAKTASGRRQVPLTTNAAEILRRWIEKFRGEFAFPKDDSDFSPATKELQTKHAKVVGKLSLDFRLYDCRHTFATRAIECGVELTY
jgi:integrase